MEKMKRSTNYEKIPSMLLQLLFGNTNKIVESRNIYAFPHAKVTDIVQYYSRLIDLSAVQEQS